MQLYASDKTQNLVFAKHALRQADYYCLECHGVVRVRGGMHRQTHFYHCTSLSECRQNGKSMQHLQVQFHIQALLPQGECVLEHRFPDIGRIADVLWEKQKLIFEIQCSPISSEEVIKRNLDYFKKGYQVIWIFHDSIYNKWRLTAAENVLSSAPHYFTNIDVEGQGVIYDNFGIYLKGQRKKITPSFAVNLKEPKKMPPISILSTFPNRLLVQRGQWPLHFSGDFLDRFLDETNSERDHYLEKIGKWDQVEEDPKTMNYLMLLWEKWILRPYFLAFQILLERYCR